MRQILLLLQAQAAEWKNRKKTLMWIGIVLIICMISTFSYVKNRENEEPAMAGKLTLGVANEDGSEYSELLISYFVGNENFSSFVDVTEGTEEELRRLLETGKLDAYLFIPEQFAQSLIVMEHVPVRAVVSMRQPTKALLFRQVLEAYETYIRHVEVQCTVLYDRMKLAGFSASELNKANMDISLDLIFTALGKDDFFRIRQVERKQEITLAEHYFFTLLFCAGAFLFLPAGNRILKWKQTGMVSRFKTMRISMGAVIAAAALPYLAGIFVATGSMLYLRRSFDVRNFLCAVLLFVAVLLVALGLGAALQKRKDYLFAYSMVLCVITVLGGGIVPKQYLPDLFARIAMLLPNERFVLLMTGNETQIGKVCLVCAVITTGCFFFGTTCLVRRGEAKEDA